MINTSEIFGITDEFARGVIWKEFSVKINATDFKEITKEVNRRKSEVHKKLASFSRIRYFNLFNDMIRTSFYRVVDKVASENDLNFLKFAGFGTEQWSDDSLNFMVNEAICGNLCVYCYIVPIFNQYKWFDIKQIIANVEKEGVLIVSGKSTLSYEQKVVKRIPAQIDLKKETMSWSSKHGLRKLYMSPTRHDIFPESVDFIIKKWKVLLKAGHYLLIVSKPLMSCISKIAEELIEYKDRVNFRFTITSDDQNILNLWEPFAPLFEERIECLKLVKNRGYGLSVSIEPFLSNPITLIEKLTPLVDEMWIGMMNWFPSEKIYGKPFSTELKEDIARIKKMYQFDKMAQLVSTLRINRKVQWKESFLKLYLK